MSISRLGVKIQNLVLPLPSFTSQVYFAHESNQFVLNFKTPSMNMAIKKYVFKIQKKSLNVDEWMR